MTTYDDSRLKEMGKSAADLSTVSGIPMDEAVTRKLSSLQLSEEQVRRVVEHANIAAFRNKHASMQAPNRVVDFDAGPADPSVVWDKLQASQSFGDDRPPIDLSPSDYAAEPVLKMASAPELDLGLEEVPADSPEVAFRKLASLHAQLEQAHEILSSDKANAGLSMREHLEDLVDRVKSASLEGATYHELVGAWEAAEPRWVGVAVRACALEPEAGKIASHRRINPEAPVVSVYAEFAKAASDYTTRHQAVMDIEQRLVAVTEAANELAKVAGLGSMLSAGRRGLAKATSKVAPGLNRSVGSAAKAGLGTAGKIGKGVAKGVGYGALGVGALGAYGAYKGIQGAGDIMSGTGKAIGNIGAPGSGRYGG